MTKDPRRRTTQLSKRPTDHPKRKRTRTFGWVKSPTGDAADAKRRLRIVLKALDVFDTQDTAKAWLNAPHIDLNDQAPIEYLGTDEGALEISHLLDRMVAQRNPPQA